MMKRRALVSILFVTAALLGLGCFMGHMTTARPVGEGKVGLTGAAGFVPANKILEDAVEGLEADDEAFGAINLQGRLDIGLSDSLDLGLSTGAGVMLIPYWMGAEAELKYCFVNDPDSVSLAAGVDLGLTLFGLTAGGALYLDSNLPYLPLHLSARPQYTFASSDGDEEDPEDEEDYEGGFFINLAAGLHFDLGDSTRLLLEATSFNPTADDEGLFRLWSFGAGVQFVF